MKNPWIAAVLNFFFIGLGTLYVGKRKLFGLVLTLGALSLTYVEFQVKTYNMSLYNVMFATVLIMNVFFAMDGYQEAKQTASPAMAQ